MSKRGATTDINHDNWNAPLEAEEPGVFSPASQEELQKRVIKTAKRRIKTTSDNSDPGKKSNIFASFGGFKPAATLNSTNTDASVTSKPTFGSLGSTLSSSSGSSTSVGGDTKAAFSFLANMAPSKAKPTANGPTVTPTTNSEKEAQEKYVANLKHLNKTLSDWLKQSLDENPVCILSNIFKEYDNYLKKLQEERDKSAASLKPPTSTANPGLSTFNFAPSNPTNHKFNINLPTKSTDGSKPTTIEDKEDDSGSSNEDSGKSPLLQNKDNKPTPSIFGSFKSDSSGSSLFSKPDAASLMVNPFLSKTQSEAKPKPFSFSNGAGPTSFNSVSSSNTKESNEKEDEEEESDEPPKVEFTPVQEEGSLFSTRCKVFVKKDATYTERGVGTLFIKQVSEGKHQLLVRAETVIGTVLLNTLLSTSIPTQRMGKNNVMLVCVPTPSEKPPPTTVLLRVKTADEADQLLATIQKYKQ